MGIDRLTFVYMQAVRQAGHSLPNVITTISMAFDCSYLLCFEKPAAALVFLY